MWFLNLISGKPIIRWIGIFETKQYICEFMDKSIRSFIWKEHNDNGMHMVGWDKVTKPKRDGGQGIQKIRSHNTTLLESLFGS